MHLLRQMIFVDVTHDCVLKNGWVRYETYSIMVSPNDLVIWGVLFAHRLAHKYDQILCQNEPITQYYEGVQFVPQFSQKSIHMTFGSLWYERHVLLGHKMCPFCINIHYNF